MILTPLHHKAGKNLCYKAGNDLIVIVAATKPKVVTVDGQTRIPTLSELIEIKNLLMQGEAKAFFEVTETETIITLIEDQNDSKID